MKNKSKIIKSGNFEYVMTAFSYCIWICFKKISGPVRYRVNRIVISILNFCLPRYYKIRYERNRKSVKAQMDYFFNNIRSGMHINDACDLVIRCWAGYCNLIFFPIFLSIMVYLDFYIGLFCLIIIGILWLGLLRSLDKRIFDDYKYIDFFEYFEQQSNEWHKKWNILTLLFVLGSLLSSLLGILVTFWLLFR